MAKFACKFCGKGFGRQSSVTKHENESCHKNLNRVTLKCPKCGKKLGTTSGVENHLKYSCPNNVTVERKKSTCNYCGKTYGTCSLAKHVMTSHPEKGDFAKTYVHAQRIKTEKDRKLDSRLDELGWPSLTLEDRDGYKICYNRDGRVASLIYDHVDLTGATEKVERMTHHVVIDKAMPPFYSVGHEVLSLVCPKDFEIGHFVQACNHPDPKEIEACQLSSNVCFMHDNVNKGGSWRKFENSITHLAREVPVDQFMGAIVGKNPVILDWDEKKFFIPEELFKLAIFKLKGSQEFKYDLMVFPNNDTCDGVHSKYRNLTISQFNERSNLGMLNKVADACVKYDIVANYNKGAKKQTSSCRSSVSEKCENCATLKDQLSERDRIIAQKDAEISQLKRKLKVLADRNDTDSEDSDFKPQKKAMKVNNKP